jgi:hypothetical protein
MAPQADSLASCSSSPPPLNVTDSRLGMGIPSWLGLASGARGASYRPR